MKVFILTYFLGLGVIGYHLAPQKSKAESIKDGSEIYLGISCKSLVSIIKIVSFSFLWP